MLSIPKPNPGDFPAGEHDQGFKAAMADYARQVEQRDIEPQRWGLVGWRDSNGTLRGHPQHVRLSEMEKALDQHDESLLGRHAYQTPAGFRLVPIAEQTPDSGSKRR